METHLHNPKMTNVSYVSDYVSELSDRNATPNLVKSMLDYGAFGYNYGLPERLIIG